MCLRNLPPSTPHAICPCQQAEAFYFDGSQYDRGQVSGRGLRAVLLILVVLVGDASRDDPYRATYRCVGWRAVPESLPVGRCGHSTAGLDPTPSPEQSGDNATLVETLDNVADPARCQQPLDSVRPMVFNVLGVVTLAIIYMQGTGVLATCEEQIASVSQVLLVWLAELLASFSCVVTGVFLALLVFRLCC